NNLSWSFRDDCLTTAGLEMLFNERPNHAILFCNVLGQWPYLMTRPSIEATIERLAECRTHSWASYHDILSLHASVKPQAIPESSHAHALLGFIEQLRHETQCSE